MKVARGLSQLRIIGGRWRGRKLAFAPVPGLRPTPDRVRETLFNWLQPVIQGACCLDLFAGSGALGIEAVSRGAAHCTLVEQDAQVVAVLREQLERLDALEIELLRAQALDWLHGPAQPFDIVFLDPPFQSGLLQPAMELLETRGWLAPQAWIYLESAPDTQPVLPPGWSWHREKRAGGVSYRLARRDVGTAGH
jgi:16S rRNA (guanine966-N2)-methyltransferase